MSGHPEKGFFIVFEGPTLKETKKNFGGWESDFKKREKHPWRSVTFSKSATNFTKSSTPP